MSNEYDQTVAAFYKWWNENNQFLDYFDSVNNQSGGESEKTEEQMGHLEAKFRAAASEWYRALGGEGTDQEAFDWAMRMTGDLKEWGTNPQNLAATALYGPDMAVARTKPGDIPNSSGLHPRASVFKKDEPRELPRITMPNGEVVGVDYREGAEDQNYNPGSSGGAKQDVYPTPEPVEVVDTSTGETHQVPYYIASLAAKGMPEVADKVGIKSWADMTPEEQEMERNLLQNTLGLKEMGIRTRDELPDGETAAGYFQVQDAMTKWQKWEKTGKVFEIRQKLFDAGYYRGTSQDGPAWSIDFSEGVNTADINALQAAMEDANLEDPLQGGATLGLQKFLRGETREIQESVSERAQLRQDIKTRMYRYGLSETQTSVDSYVDKLMNGTIAYSDMDKAMLDRAKQLYPAWVKQLDSGMTMDQIADPYVSRAEAILEVPNMTWDDPLLAGALNTPGKDGSPSYMSLTEFNDKLRDDPRWEYTTDAHNYYGGLQNKIMETWGM